MPPILAAAIFTVGIIGLFLIGRERSAPTSGALWLPIVWLSIGASRSFGQWLGLSPMFASPDQLLEGSPIDRLIFVGMVLWGVGVLVARRRRTLPFLKANWPLLLFFLYCLVSVLWSDFPFTAFKRWTKAVGNLVMVLIVITEAYPTAAITRLLMRPAFVLIPVSILLNKYYPAYSRGFSTGGAQHFTGVATSKNNLGVVCLIFGLAVVWKLLGNFGEAKRNAKAGPRIAQITVLGMALYLFWLIDSVTSAVCLLAGVILIAVARRVKKPALLHLLVWGMVCLSLAALFLEVGGGLVETMGRDTTLTGRTELWERILAIPVNRWVGTGFESFWLGERLEPFWAIYPWRPNQSHNGYIETLVTLGWVGVALLGFIIAWGYRNVFRSLEQEPVTGRLKLAFFVIALIYNLTEAGFKVMAPVWITFLLSVAVVPQLPRQQEGSKNGLPGKTA